MGAADPGKGGGIHVGDETVNDLGEALSYIEGAERYSGPTRYNVDLPVARTLFGTDVESGQYVSSEKAASLAGSARKKKTPSGIVKP